MNNAYPDEGASTGDNMKQDLEALRSDFESFVKEQGKQAGDVVSKATDKVKDWAGDAKDKAESLHKKVCDVAADRPMTTIACALVAGIVIGKIMGWTMAKK